MDSNERILHAYFFAKHYIISKGYGNEVDWQCDINCIKLTKRKFLEEFSWVVLASGMNDKVVRKVYPMIKTVMFDFETSIICEKIAHCRKEALSIFNHEGKINAILYLVEYLQANPFDTIKARILNEGVTFIQTFPYMGKATSFHLAKNIGINVAKPDRHLNRISNTLGYDDPNDLCRDIANRIYENISLIDLVLWRYATLDKNYIKNIDWYIKRATNDH